MAPFNPVISPTGDPNYSGASRGTSQPDADKTLGMAVAGVGNLFELGVKAADTYVKENLKDKIYNLVETERDAFTSSLEDTRLNLAGPGADPNVGIDPQSGLDAFAAATPESLVQTPTELPLPLQNISQKVGILRGAYEKGLPYSAYYGRLASLAKELRQQNHGYKDYIDNQFARVLGTDPANAYIRAQVANINAALSSQGATTNKLLSKMYQEIDIPGMPDAIEYVRRTGDVRYGEKFLNERLGFKYDAERRKDDLDKMTTDRKAKELATKDFIVDDVYKTAVQFFQTVNTKMGLTTPKDVENYLTRVSAGTETLTEVQGHQLIQYMTEIRNQAFNQKYKEYHQQRKDADGRSYTIASSLDGGSAEVTKKINEGLTQFDQVLDRLKGKEYGLAFNEGQRIIAMENGAKLGLYTSGDFGRSSLVMKTLQATYPQYAQKYLEQLMNGQNVNLDKTFKTYLEDHVTSAITQSNVFEQINRTLAPPIPAAPGQAPAPQTSPSNPVTLNSIFAHAQNKRVAEPEFYKKVPEILIKELTSPNTPVDIKRNIITTLFDPSNRNHLQYYNKETQDSSGRTIPGKYSVWFNMAKPDVANAAISLGGAEAKNYIDWIKNEAAHQLFGNEIRDLNDLRIDPRIRVSYNNDPKDPNYGFSITRTNTPVGQYTATAGDINQLEYQAKQVTGRLNIMLRGLANVNAAAGADVKQTDAFITRLMMDAGFDPNKQPTFPLIKGQMIQQNPIQALGMAIFNANREVVK